MELTPYVDAIRRDLSAATALADEATRSVAERLGGTLDTSTRLAMFDALSQACAEISRDLSPGSVEVRIAGREPQFVVTSPPRMGPSTEPTRPTPPTAPVAPEAPTAPDATSELEIAETEGAEPEDPESEDDSFDDDGSTARITLRLPSSLKTRVEDAAVTSGRSVNAWLIDAVTHELRDQRRDGRERRENRRSGRGLEIDLPDFANLGAEISRQVNEAMRGVNREIREATTVDVRTGDRDARRGRAPGVHVSGWVR